MKGHFSKIDCHLLDQVLLNLLGLLFRIFRNVWRGLLFLVLHLLVLGLWGRRSIALRVCCQGGSFLFLSLRSILDFDSENFEQIHLQKVEDSRRMNFIVNGLHDFQFKRFDPRNLKFFVSYFLVDSLHLQWIDVLEFGGDEHRGHSRQVQIAHLLGRFTVLEVSIHQRRGEEEGLVVAPEICQDFDHPVNHSCSEARINFMAVQAIRSIISLLKLSQITVDVLV